MKRPYRYLKNVMPGLYQHILETVEALAINQYNDAGLRLEVLMKCEEILDSNNIRDYNVTVYDLGVEKIGFDIKLYS